jgi:hypothetical protein
VNIGRVITDQFSGDWIRRTVDMPRTLLTSAWHGNLEQVSQANKPCTLQRDKIGRIIRACDNGAVTAR